MLSVAVLTKIYCQRNNFFLYIFRFFFFPFLSFSNFHSWFSFFLRNIISILILKKYNHSKWTVVCFSLASILIDWLISWLVSIWQMGRVGKLHFQFRSNFFVVDIIFLVWDVTVTLITHTHQLIILKVIYQIRCDDQWKCLTSMYLFFPFFKAHVFLIDWLTWLKITHLNFSLFFFLVTKTNTNTQDPSVVVGRLTTNYQCLIPLDNFLSVFCIRNQNQNQRARSK